MAKKIRRQPVVWLPTDINNRLSRVPPAVVTSGNETNHFLQVIVGPASAPGLQQVDLIPIVKDDPKNIAAAEQTLSDLEGSAYRLRRIVGKLHVAMAQSANVEPTETSTSIVTSGFIILKVDVVGAPLQTPDQYNPSSMDSVRDPWIWRRSWVLRNRLNALSVALDFPPSNAAYGSVADGPHVDAKTARVVSDEERLFLVTSVTAIDGTGGLLTSPSILIVGDLRVLASMRKSSGNRNNASR